MSLNAPGTAYLERLFSPAVFNDFAERGYSAVFRAAFEGSGLMNASDPENDLGSAYEKAFSELISSKYADVRGDFVYRAALIEKIVLGRHSLSTATLLREFRVEKSKVDVAILNGTSTAYEIKSNRDNLVRLEQQIENYKRVFAAVNVVTSGSQIPKVLAKVPDTVGVIELTRRFTLRVVRQAEDQPGNIDPVAVLNSVRIDEAKAILNILGIHVPEYPNGVIRTKLESIFSALNPVEVHKAMLEVLKNTRSKKQYKGLIEQLPCGVASAFLSSSMQPELSKTILSIISTSINAAKEWR